MGHRWHAPSRRWHRWVSAVIAAPFLVVLITGILLQLKKELPWVQPPTQRGVAKQPTLEFSTMLAILRSIPEAEVNDWNDVDRLDVQPARGLVKLQCRNRWEVQLDASTGEILQIAYRRSDWIESLHDGSGFHERAKLGLFLPVAVLVLSLWLTGLYLFALPLVVRWRRKGRGSENRA